MPKRHSLDRMSIAVATLALAISLLAGHVLLRSLEAARDSGAWVVHTMEVRYAMTTMRAAFNRALSTARGFALQGDAGSRANFENSVAATWEWHRTLTGLVAADPAQTERMRRLGAGLDAYFAELGGLIAARESGGLQAAAERAERGIDQFRADSLRQLIEGALEEQNTLLAERLKAQARDQDFVAGLVVTLVTVALLLMAGALLALRIDRRRRILAETSLVSLNKSLESTVLHRTAEVEAARARIEAMFEAMSDAMNAVDSQWRYTFVSKRAAKLLGRDPATLLGRRMWDLYPDLEHGPLHTLGDAVMASGVPAEGEMLLENYNRVWYAYHIAPLDGGLAIYYHDVTRRKRQELQLRDFAERMERLSRRLMSVGEERRRALSRELHDEFGQSLTALKLTLAALGREPGAGREARLADANGLVDQLIAQVRDHTLELRPALLDDRGLAAAVAEYVARQSELNAVAIEYDPAPAEGLALPADTTLTAFRLVQESIHNALRHARCSRIEVAIERDDGHLRVEIRDNGRGIEAARMDVSAAPSTGLGVEGMRERVSLGGGRFAIESRPGFGVVVRAALPLNALAVAGTATATATGAALERMA